MRWSHCGLLGSSNLAVSAANSRLLGTRAVKELQELRKNPSRIYVSTGNDTDERPRPEEQEKGMEPRQPESPAVLLPTRLTSSTPPCP
ncbi:hypothetical protein BDW75DRAFT_34152 [Aspergillus navahoensis]